MSIGLKYTWRKRKEERERVGDRGWRGAEEGGRKDEGGGGKEEEKESGRERGRREILVRRSTYLLYG